MTGCTDYQEGHAGVMGLPPDLENYASDLKAKTKLKLWNAKKQYVDQTLMLAQYILCVNNQNLLRQLSIN